MSQNWAKSGSYLKFRWKWIKSFISWQNSSLDRMMSQTDENLELSCLQSLHLVTDVWRAGLRGNLWDKGTQLGQVESTFSLALSSLHLSTFFDLGVAFIRFQYITSTFCLHPDFYIIRLHQVAWHQGPGHRASQVRIQIWSALQPHFCSRFVVSFIFEIIF